MSDRDEFLKARKHRANVLICGARDPRKTAVLRSVVAAIPAGERVEKIAGTPEADEGAPEERGQGRLKSFLLGHPVEQEPERGDNR